MADCRKCRHNYKPSTCEPKCNRMCDGESDFEPITNAMRIRAMSDEELAGLTIDYNVYYGEYYCSDGECYDYYEDAIKHEIKWLQSEAE